MKKIYCIKTEGIGSVYCLNRKGEQVHYMNVPCVFLDDPIIGFVPLNESQLLNLVKFYLLCLVKNLLRKKRISGISGIVTYDGESYEIVFSFKVINRICQLYVNEMKKNIKSFFTKRLGK